MNTEEYMNRDIKRKSWEEIVNIFINKEDATIAEKNECGKHVR